MHMYMIFTHNTFQNHDVFGFTHLQDQISTPHFNVANQNVIPILRHPHNMRRQSRDTMASGTDSVHKLTVPALCKWVATESLALKCMVSTSELRQ